MGSVEVRYTHNAVMLVTYLNDTEQHWVSLSVSPEAAENIAMWLVKAAIGVRELQLKLKQEKGNAIREVERIIGMENGK